MSVAPNLSQLVPEYAVNDRCMYRGNPEDIWTIVSIHYPIGARDAIPWAWAVKNDRAGRPTSGERQWFPHGVFTKIEEPKKASRTHRVPPGAISIAGRRPEANGKAPVAGPGRPEKVRKPPAGRDVIADLMDEGDRRDIARLAGMDVEALRAKVGHLNPGLQRMNIGNRLRAAWKRGEFYPAPAMARLIKKGKAK